MTYADWDVNIAGQIGQPGGPTGSQGPAGPGYLATSVTSNTIGIGSKTFVTQPGLAYSVGARCRIASRGSGSWMEGVCTAYDPVGGSITLNVDMNSATAGTANLAGIPNCGRLRCSGNGNAVTSLTFLPFMGDLIKIQGVIYQIPATGIVGLANTNVYVNGVANQNLAANTLYYVYAFNNGGVLTADFWSGSAGAHATSSTPSNVGIEIRSGDDTRSLIGMVYVGGGILFNDIPQSRLTRSWFNRPRIDVASNYVSSVSIPGSSTWVSAGATSGFVIFAGELIQVSLITFYASTVNTMIYASPWMDGALWGQDTQVTAQSGFFAPLNMSYPYSATPEGYHTLGFAADSANAITAWGQVVAVIG